MRIYFIYVTFGSLKEAKALAGKLVKNRLAACANIIPTIYSTYVWNKKTVIDRECSMIIKTSKNIAMNVPLFQPFQLARHILNLKNG